MSVPAICFLVATALYAGFQWTIRLVVYPQLAAAGRTDFVTYELAHQRRVSVAVGPLFVALLVTTAAIVWAPPAGTQVWAQVTAAVLLLVELGATWLLAVPEHRALSEGFGKGSSGPVGRPGPARTIGGSASSTSRRRGCRWPMTRRWRRCCWPGPAATGWTRPSLRWRASRSGGRW